MIFNKKFDELQSLQLLDLEARSRKFEARREREVSLSTLVDKNDVLGPLSFAEKIDLNKIVLVGDHFFCRFRIGESVEIREALPRKDISKPFSDGWKIRQIFYHAPGKIQIILEGPKGLDLEKNKDLYLFKADNVSMIHFLSKRLRDLKMRFPDEVLGQASGRLKQNDDNFQVLFQQLNDKQRTAVSYLIEHNLNGAIQGPPGTGKTQLLQAVIALAVNSGLRVGITSFTNAAVDNVLGRLSGVFSEDQCVRVGNSSEVDNFSEELINQFQVFGVTLHKLAFSASTPIFDLIVVDEAGQVPIYFFPLFRRIAKRLILVGDQYQLPPVSSVEQNIIPYEDVFSYVVGEETPMLETQYRMRTEIQNWSSQKFYKSLLRPDERVANRDYFESSPAFLSKEAVLYKTFYPDSSKDSSRLEADFLAEKLGQIVRSGESLDTVGIISPHRRHAGMINAVLQNKFGVDLAAKVLVDTVERFQGQEKEAVFLTFGSSDGCKNELKFFSNPKRLNVTITRAKSRFICLMSQKVWENSHKGVSPELSEFLTWMRDRRIKIKKAA